MALFALLICTSSVAAQAIGPKANPAQPPIFVPIPSGSPFNCRLHTDWAPLSRAKQPVWRHATRVEGTEIWKEAECGRAGSRFRTLTEQSEFTQAHATAGRMREGDGGIGVGAMWKVFLGSDLDARLEVEFTRPGPRIVVSATYWPIHGREIAVGWSLLSNELVHRHGWYFDAEDISGMWFWHVEVPLRVACDHFLAWLR